MGNGLFRFRVAFDLLRHLCVRLRVRLIDKNLKLVSSKVWGLREWDTFSSESYDFGERFLSEKSARRAARKKLVRLEKWQPTEMSGGQDGIQDQMWIVRPDGSAYRFTAE